MNRHKDIHSFQSLRRVQFFVNRQTIAWVEIELRNNLNSFLIFSFSRRKFLSEIEYDEVMSVCVLCYEFIILLDMKILAALLVLSHYNHWPMLSWADSILGKFNVFNYDLVSLWWREWFMVRQKVLMSATTVLRYKLVI